MKIENPYHAGELEAQRRAGETLIAERNGVVIADTIIAGALPFLKQQTMAVTGTVDPDGTRWAFPIFGIPGFLSPDDDRTVRCIRGLMKPQQLFWQRIRTGNQIGLLAIELATRRRLRVNGTLETVDQDGFVVAVREAYPNCPKYIQRRTLTWLDGPADQLSETASEGTHLSPEAKQLLDSVDTLFIASAEEQRGVDVSHRGGHPGFIQRLNDTTIRVPDYPGNSMFNTFGNLITDSRAGVTAMDFAGGRALQMTGNVELQWNETDELGLTGGTGRFWTFHVDRWRVLPLPSAARWDFQDASPFNPRVA